MRLDREPGSAHGRHRRAHQHVVGEDEVGGKMRGQRPRVERDVPLPLLPRHLLEQDRLQPLVPVEHEDGQQAPDLRAHDLGAGQVEPLRVRLLAEDDDLVAGAAPLAGDRPRVDVRAGAVQQVPVPEEDPHRSDGPAL